MNGYFSFEKLKSILTYVENDPLIFSTSLFMILFAGVLLIYNLLHKNKNLRILFLIFFSLYFYYKSAGYYFGIIILSALVNYYIGKFIAATENFTIKRLWLWSGIAVNIGLLSYFKYTNFLLQIYNDISNGTIEPLAIFLPIGISFYTFKSLSYIFDIYLDLMPTAKNLRDFSLYVFFFPNILAGPIDRASDFIPQIDKEPFVSNEDLGRAVFLISLGLIKKVIIADYISLNFVDRIFDYPLRYTGMENLLAMYGYTLQVYCDFSGYSDMAIGIALFMGFKLMDNFNSPFKATSVADFWRRWHISLSKWLLDYLFKPMQFSFRQMRIFGNMFALTITFLICGIWHGAGWNFIYWGLLHGIFMSVGILLQKPKTYVYKKLKIYNTPFLKFFQVIITFHLIVFSFLVFRTPDTQIIKDVISQIYEFLHPEVFFQFMEEMPVVFALFVIGYLFHFLPSVVEKTALKAVTWLPWIGKALLLAAVIWIAAQFKSADIQPFIYFQF